MARYALIIGITEYQSPHLSRLPKAATDAEIVAQVLEQYGNFLVKRVPESWTPERTRKVGEKKVTGAELGQELETLLLKQATGNEALIYFAGHGFTVSDNLGEQQGFLATSDCQIEMSGEVAITQKYGISLESLNRLIGKSELSSLVMLLDCCHSGYFLERNLIQQTLTEFSSQKDYYLITACRSYEQAKSFKGEEHSIFTGALLKGLAAENASNHRGVTGDRLFDFISAELKNSVQEPIRMGWGRSITLVNYPHKEPTTVEVTFNRENPYLGLRAFESEQHKYFFGREQAVRSLLDRLSNNRFLAVIGPSGCGKSSLVKAGLLPQLKSDRLPGSSQWDVESFAPGRHPLGILIEILQRRDRQDRPFVLLIDQFEEVFTLCDNPTERLSFIRLMAEQATASEQVARVIATIRGDFLDRCAEYPDAVSLINCARPTTYVVTPMSRQELEEAMEKPAALHGVAFESGLVSQIVHDVDNQPGALPLLQYALSELWRVFCLQDSPSGQPLLTWKDYEQIGGVKGALDKRATLLYQSFTAENQAFVRRLCMELVQVNEGEEVTRRRATWEELNAVADSPEQLQQVVGLLSDQQQRLIITDQNKVEVAHEALLTEWKLLRDWIEKNRENLQLRRRLESDCREWQETYQKSDGALLTGARLAAIAEWMEKTQPKLPQVEAEFLQKSLEKRDREAEAQLEQERELRKAAEDRAKAEKQRTLVAAGAGVVGVILVTFFGLLQIQLAKRSEVKSLIAIARTFKKNNDQLEALMTSVKALNELKQVFIGRDKFLEQLQPIIYEVQERNRLEDRKAAVLGVSISDDGQFIVSANADNSIQIWNITGKLEKTFENAHKDVWSVRFSPKSQDFASIGLDGKIRLGNAKNKELKIPFIAHNNEAYDVSFSLKNRLLASSGRDGKVKVWNIENSRVAKSGEINATDYIQEKKYKTRGFYRIFGVDFHPKREDIIAYSSDTDGSIKLWDGRSQDPPVLLGQHLSKQEAYITLVRFNHDGSLLASSASNGTIAIWRTRDKQLIGKIEGGSNDISGLAFSPNNNENILASGSDDNTIKIWKLDDVIKSFKANQKPVQNALVTLEGHKNQINALQFSSNGQFIVSASNDNTVRIWQWQPKSNIQQPLKLRELTDDSCTLLHDYLNTNKNISSDYQNLCRS